MFEVAYLRRALYRFVKVQIARAAAPGDDGPSPQRRVRPQLVPAAKMARSAARWRADNGGADCASARACSYWASVRPLAHSGT